MYREIPNRIAEKYSKMTKSEKKIADYLMNQKDDLHLTSITEFSERFGVADSTMFRFCKRLGYNGYNDFKLALAKEQGAGSAGQSTDEEADVYSSIRPEDDIPTTGQKLRTMYCAALEQTLGLLKPQNVAEAARIFLHSERVYCFGQGGSLITGMEAWTRFSTVTNKFLTIEDTGQQVIAASLFTEKDTVWFFSYSGSTKDAVDILSRARGRGAKVVLVTRYAKSPATQYADVVLMCGSNETPFQSGAIVAKVAQLLVIDMVYQEYLRLTPLSSNDNLIITANVVASRQM